MIRKRLQERIRISEMCARDWARRINQVPSAPEPPQAEEKKKKKKKKKKTKAKAATPEQKEHGGFHCDFTMCKSHKTLTEAEQKEEDQRLEALADQIERDLAEQDTETRVGQDAARKKAVESYTTFMPSLGPEFDAMLQEWDDIMITEHVDPAVPEK
jgi:transposase